MLGLVRQVRPPVLHLRDLRVRIRRALPVLVRALLRPAPIQPRQRRARRRANSRRLRQTRQVLLVRLARVAPHDAPHRRVRLQRRPVHQQRLALHQAALAPDAPSTQVNTSRCVSTSISRRVREIVEWSGPRSLDAQAQEAPHRQRVGSPPGDPALRVEPFEVPEQQQPEVPPRQQARPTHLPRVEPLAALLREAIEPASLQHRVQALIERVPGALRQLARRDPHRPACRFFRLPIAMCPQSRHTALSRRYSMAVSFTTGC